MKVHYKPYRTRAFSACGILMPPPIRFTPDPEAVTCGACRRTRFYRSAGESLADLVRYGVIKSIRPPADVRGAAARRKR